MTESTTATSPQTSAEIIKHQADALKGIMDKDGELGVPVLSFEQAVRDLQPVIGATAVDKSELEGKPFIVLGFKLVPSAQYDGDFAVVRVMAQDNREYVFTDGSVGVKDQLISFAKLYQRNFGFLAMGGLKKSEYDTEIDGKTVHGTTYYLN